jgi:hypothetical protein
MGLLFVEHERIEHEEYFVPFVLHDAADEPVGVDCV